MKKILILLLLAILLSGCEAIDKADAELASSDMFVTVSYGIGPLYHYVVYQKNTKVMYTVSKDGEFTLLVNEDGKPLIYKGVQNE